MLANKDLSSLKALSKEQLKGLFTGQIVNWKQVGGPDLPVVVVYGVKIPGTNKLWQEQIMDGAAWSAQRREVSDAATVKKAVAFTPGAIGIGPQAAEDGTSAHSPQSPEVSRPITAVTPLKASPSVQKLFDYIAGEGQKYIVN